MQSLRRRLLCLPLFPLLTLTFCLFLAPAAAAGPPPEEAAFPRLEESLAELESSLASEPPAAAEIRRGLAELRYFAAATQAPVDDLLTRLAGQLGRLAGGAESADRLPEVRRRAGLTISALRGKLAAVEEASQPGAAPGTESIVAPPVNDSCANATAVTAGTVFGDTTDASNDGSASCGGSGSSPDVWYSYTATDDGLVTFDTEGSLLDTVLSLHSSCPDADGDHELTCNDDNGSGLDSLVGRPMSSGESVLIRVSGAGGATGSFQLDTDDSAGGITGTVTKEGTGEPLAGVLVQISDQDGWWLAGTTSGADGTYLVPGLTAGNRIAEANDNVSFREVWEDVECPVYCDVVDVGTPIPVAGNLVEDIDFSLSRGGTITGVVTDARTGEPLGGLNYSSTTWVSAYDLSGNLLRTVSSDEEGRYVLSGLPGEVKLFASSTYHRAEVWDSMPCDLDCDPTSGTTVVVGEGSSADGYDFALTRLGSIAGAVTDFATGAPIPYLAVRFTHADDGFDKSTQTDSGGEYHMQGLPTGDYFVYTDAYEYADKVYDDVPCTPDCPVTSGARVAVSLDTTSSGVNFALDSLGSISGTLTTADGGRFSGALRVYDSSGQWVEGTSIYGSDVDWTAYPLHPGTYYLLAYPYGDHYEATGFQDLGCNPDCDVTQGTPVEVGVGTSVVGLSMVVDACSADSYADLVALTLFSDAAYEACREIRAGDAVTVKNGAHLNLTAGRRVSFGNGFRIEAGGSLAVTIDPEVASD